MLGGREFRRQRAARVARELGGVAQRRLVFEELGDSEIQQLDVAAFPDQHVRRFEVAVNDQIRVRLRDCGEYFEKQAQARTDIETLGVAVDVDRLALDVLEHEVRLTRVGDAGVDQSRDVRMRKSREEAALATKAFLARSAYQGRVQELDGYPAFEAPVAATREPDTAHPALAELFFQRVRAKRVALERARRRERRQRAVREKAFAFDDVALGEQRFDIGRERLVLLPQLAKPRQALAALELQRAIEQRAQRLPAFGRENHCYESALLSARCR